MTIVLKVMIKKQCDLKATKKKLHQVKKSSELS